MSSVMNIVKDFERFLGGERFGEFVLEWRGDGKSHVEVSVEEWLCDMEPRVYLSNAFVWSDSFMGYDYWCDLNVEWLCICSDNGWLSYE